MRGAHGGLLLIGAIALAAFLPACELVDVLLDDDGGPSEGVSCEVLCEIEDGCELRAYDECVAESCDDAGMRVPSASDECMQAALDCAAVAECTCDDSCGKLDECTGSDDPACPDTCVSLIEQDVVGTFQENRCRIESSCDDLALCSGE